MQLQSLRERLGRDTVRVVGETATLGERVKCPVMTVISHVDTFPGKYLLSSQGGVELNVEGHSWLSVFSTDTEGVISLPSTRGKPPDPIHPPAVCVGQQTCSSAAASCLHGGGSNAQSWLEAQKLRNKAVAHLNISKKNVA